MLEHQPKSGGQGSGVVQMKESAMSEHQFAQQNQSELSPLQPSHETGLESAEREELQFVDSEFAGI